MKIHPRLGTGIVCIIYSVLILSVVKILDIDLKQIKIFYYVSNIIIAISAVIIFNRLYNKDNEDENVEK